MLMQSKAMGMKHYNHAVEEKCASIYQVGRCAREGGRQRERLER
jgi:hypothetical protein